MNPRNEIIISKRFYGNKIQPQVEQLPPAHPEQPDDDEPESPLPALGEENDEICLVRSSLPQEGQRGRSGPIARNSNRRPQARQIKSKSGIILQIKIFHTAIYR